MLRSACRVSCAAWLLSALAGATSAHAVIPGQFIAKMYLELLGRAPNGAEWNAYVNYFQANPCSQATLKAVGLGFVGSSEYKGTTPPGLNYDKCEQVLTLYRGILNREPDPGGFKNWVNNLNAGGTPESVATAFFNSTEFANLVPSICGTNGSRGSYSFGASQALRNPPPGVSVGTCALITANPPTIAIMPVGPCAGVPPGAQCFTGGTASELNLQLANNPTVYLAQRAVVVADTTVVIPQGKTLTTAPGPNPTQPLNRYQYAKEGRIVRNSLFHGHVVSLGPGATLSNVFVSGQRIFLQAQYPGQDTYLENECPGGSNCYNILANSGTGTRILDGKSESVAAAGNVLMIGRSEGQGVPCVNSYIVGMRVTGYTGDHTSAYSDGIGISCEGATVAENDVVDMTDVAIAVFAQSGVPQASSVRTNRVIAAGRSAFAAYGMFPAGTNVNFEGFKLEQNSMWTSPTHHLDIGISVGGKAWGEPYAILDGGSVGKLNVLYNVTGDGGQIVGGRYQFGILADGAWNVNANGNSIILPNNPNIMELQTPHCTNPKGAAIVDTSQASGYFQPGFVVGNSNQVNDPPNTVCIRGHADSTYPP